MRLLDPNWHPTHRQLRQFAALAACALPGLGWMWGLPMSWIAGLGVCGGLGLAVSWWRPSAIAPVYRLITLLTFPIGLVVSELVLILIYGLVFVPMGVVFRLFGRDRLQRKLDRQRVSYWEDKAQPRSLKSYYRQS